MTIDDRPSDFRADIESLLNGTLDADGIRRLEASLLNDSKRQQHFLDYCQLHTDLGLSIACDRALEFTFRGIGRPATHVSSSHSRMKLVGRFLAKPTPLSMTVAALAMGLLVAAMYFMVPPAYRAMTRNERPDAPSYRIVAEITGVHDAVWDRGQVGAYPGAHLMVGHRMDLLEGLAEVTYVSGARVTLQGPATYEVQGENAALLASGRLVARVPASAVGFEVETPAAVITDLGTEFGVEAEAGGETHVAVFDGSVELTIGKGDADASPVKKRLRAGDAVVVESNGHIKAETSNQQNYRREIPPRSKAVQRLGHWRLGEDDWHAKIGGLAGETTIDRLRGRDLTTSGTPTYIGATAAQGSTVAVEFSGDSEQRFAAAQAVSTRADNWLLEVWARADSTTGTAVVVYNGDSARSGFGIIRRGDQWQALYGGVAVMGFGAKVDRGKWTHLALLRHNGVTRLLVDGVIAGGEFRHSPRVPNGGFMVGGNSLTTGQVFAGAIDEITLSYLSSDFKLEMLDEASP